MNYGPFLLAESKAKRWRQQKIILILAGGFLAAISIGVGVGVSSVLVSKAIGMAIDVDIPDSIAHDTSN